MLPRKPVLSAERHAMQWCSHEGDSAADHQSRVQVKLWARARAMASALTQVLKVGWGPCWVGIISAWGLWPAQHGVDLMPSTDPRRCSQNPQTVRVACYYDWGWGRGRFIPPLSTLGPTFRIYWTNVKENLGPESCPQLPKLVPRLFCFSLFAQCRQQRSWPMPAHFCHRLSWRSSMLLIMMSLIMIILVSDWDSLLWEWASIH